MEVSNRDQCPLNRCQQPQVKPGRPADLSATSQLLGCDAHKRWTVKLSPCTSFTSACHMQPCRRHYKAPRLLLPHCNNPHPIATTHITEVLTRSCAVATHPHQSQAVACNNRSSSTLTPLRASTRGSAPLRVVAFREDDRQGSLRRGSREAKGQVKDVQRQGQKQLQRGRNDISNINRRKCHNNACSLWQSDC